MKYYNDISVDENLRSKTYGEVRGGILYVAPEVLTLLEDEDVKDIVMRQLDIVNELREDVEVKVYDDNVLMGKAIILKYPLSATPGYALVRFLDKKVMRTDFLVRVERLRVGEGGFDNLII